jgi:hypothetical protein
LAGAVETAGAVEMAGGVATPSRLVMKSALRRFRLQAGL